jgi:hypothetical protein
MEAARPSARPRTGRLRAVVRSEGAVVVSTGELGAPGDVVEGPGAGRRRRGHHKEHGWRGHLEAGRGQ